MLEKWNQMNLDIMESDTSNSVEDKVVTKLGLSVGLGPASVSFKTENENSVIKGKKAYRKDEVVEMPLKKVNFVTTKFHTMCSDEFIAHCKSCSSDADVEWFAKNVGVFFATEC